MKLIERYIFARLLRAWLLALLTLSMTVWLTQAIRQVVLVTVQGQTFWLFFQLTLLLLPQLIAIVTPFAVLIAVTYTFTTLNSDSELVVINASGTPQSALLKPVLAVSLMAALTVGAISLYFAPLSQRNWRAEVTAVKTNVVTALLREGTFISLSEGLVFHMRDRGANGTLHGIFVSDTRESDVTSTYLATEGQVIQNPIGTFIIMNNGSIQRRDNVSGSISIIEFTSYAFDLTTFASQTKDPSFRPSEQPTSYLINPDPDDRQYRKSPASFAAELYGRLAAPLQTFIFSLVPLVYLVQADSTRRRRGLSLAVAAGTAVIVRVASSFAVSATAGSTLLAPIAFLFPLGVIVAAIVFILTGTRPKMPERVVEFADAIMEWASRLLRRSAGVGNAGW